MRHVVPYMAAKKAMEEYCGENFWVTTSGVQDDEALVDRLRSVGESRVGGV
jgi:hypothetical protein